MMQRFMSSARLSGRNNRKNNRKRAATGVLLLVLLACSAMLAPAVAEELEPPYELVIDSVVDNAFDDLAQQMRRQPALRAIFAPDQQLPGANVNRELGRVVIMVDVTTDQKGMRSPATNLL